MKKGFTMIELIFVIVILGILASVAVPRLAGTKADAEESAAVANLRTLISDLNTYYVATGNIPTDTTWSQITNVPLSNTSNTATTETKLKVGGKDCIEVQLVNKAGAVPAHILFTKNNNANSAGVCKQVVESAPVKVYLDSTLPGETTTKKMAIGSSTSVYTTK